MHKIDKMPYGYKLTFDGFIKADEMKQWVEESKRALATSPAKFGVLIDMRGLKPLPADSQPLMEEGQKAYKMAGMQRSCVILASAIQTMQFKRIARETGIDAFERYIDASSESDWEKKGIAWAKDGVEP